MEVPWVVALLLVAVAGGGVLLHERVNRRKAQNLLARRPQLGPEEFGRRYFGESEPRAALAGELREIVAHHLPFKLDGLSPADRFVEDLRMDDLDSLAAVEVLMEIETRYGFDIPDSAREAIHRFDQLVDYVEARIRSASVAGA